MKYDFTTLVDRTGTGASKWNLMRTQNPDVKPGIVPLSVADMEFKHPPELIEGLKSYLDGAILGYTSATDAYYDAVIGWMKRRHNWDIKKEWIVFTPGVVNAFYEAVSAFTEPGDNVLLMTPVYHPFYAAATKTGRNIVESALIPDENNRYSINFEDFEEKAKDPATKILLMSSPHNPLCRVWTEEELTRLGRICIDNGVLVVSDELHFDFIMPGYKHTIYADISEEFAQNVILCTAPSKSFNLAGLQCSNIIIPNEELRAAYLGQLQKSAMGGRLNMLAFKGCELVYNECEEWFDEMLSVVLDNAQSVIAYCAEHMPKVKITPLEATYLLWMDFRAYGLTNEELQQVMRMDAQVFMNDGFSFGEAGGGFMRMNLAAPKKVIMDATERIKNALAKYE